MNLVMKQRSNKLVIEPGSYTLGIDVHDKPRFFFRSLVKLSPSPQTKGLWDTVPVLEGSFAISPLRVRLAHAAEVPHEPALRHCVAKRMDVRITHRKILRRSESCKSTCVGLFTSSWETIPFPKPREDRSAMHACQNFFATQDVLEKGFRHVHSEVVARVMLL
jgi:hypothetical protein